MNKGALYETLQIDPSCLTIDQLFSLIKEFKKELLKVKEQVKSKMPSRKSLETPEKFSKEISIQKLVEERDSLVLDNRHLKEVLKSLEGELQSLNMKNKELSEIAKRQEGELRQLKVIVKTKCYKNIVNIEVLDDKKETDVLKKQLESAKEKIESLKKREEAYENANLCLRRRMMRYIANASTQKSSKIKDTQFLGESLAKLESQKENEEDCVLSTVKNSLDSFYKELLLGLQMSKDRSYCMSAESFCQIEKKINLIIMSLHENAEFTSDGKQRRRIISHGVRINAYSSQRDLGKLKAKTPLIFS